MSATERFTASAQAPSTTSMRVRKPRAGSTYSSAMSSMAGASAKNARASSALRAMAVQVVRPPQFGLSTQG